MTHTLVPFRPALLIHDSGAFTKKVGKCFLEKSDRPKMSASRGKIAVSTTLPSTPFLLSNFRQPILSSRLLIRPLTAFDLPAAHLLRGQQKVMRWTSRGRPDTNLDETEEWLTRFLAPNDVNTYNFAICLKETGEFIGCGGCHKFEGAPEGWPEFGYMLREDAWGKGLGGEFAESFVQAWWALPRSKVRLEVAEDSIVAVDDDKSTGVATPLGSGESIRAVEMLVADVEVRNEASRRILERYGFEPFRWWHNNGVDLICYRLRRPGANA